MQCLIGQHLAHLNEICTMLLTYGQAISVVLSVLELCAPVGQSDTQGEQLRSGLIAP